MKWHSKKVKKSAKEDFEKAWVETAKFLPEGHEGKGPMSAKPGGGKSHVLFDTIQKLRKAYLDLGFDEAINPVFLEDKEIRRQFGPEAAAVLDRCYYIGGLPRPDVGLGEAKIKAIEKLGVKVKKEALQDVLHKYKKGEFGGDDLVYKMAKALGVDDSLAGKILSDVFPEFRALEPESSKITLRSHMTSGWFLTIPGAMKKSSLPVKLFSIDRCFRREQQEDTTHLRTHHSASCIVVAEDASVEDGRAVARGLLKPFGFKDFEFRPDEKRSKYYAPDTQTEVYAKHEKMGWVEIATFGMYSPVALSQYGIEYPVMNLGLGVERLAMILSGAGDVRELVYSQFYGDLLMSDADIASMLNAEKSPATDEGRGIARAIVVAAQKYADEKSPCEFVAYSGKLAGKQITVKLVEKEENKKLLGPAAFNDIFVRDGNVYGLPPGKSQDVREKGVDCSIRYIDGIASLAAHNIEKSAGDGGTESVTSVLMAKSLGDVNLTLEDVAMRYITANSKKIDIRGPVFISIEASIAQD